MVNPLQNSQIWYNEVIVAQQVNVMVCVCDVYQFIYISG